MMNIPYYKHNQHVYDLNKVAFPAFCFYFEQECTKTSEHKHVLDRICYFSLLLKFVTKHWYFKQRSGFEIQKHVSGDYYK
jgi:hypothetical protein